MPARQTCSMPRMTPRSGTTLAAVKSFRAQRLQRLLSPAHIRAPCGAAGVTTEFGRRPPAAEGAPGNPVPAPAVRSSGSATRWTFVPCGPARAAPGFGKRHMRIDEARVDRRAGHVMHPRIRRHRRIRSHRDDASVAQDDGALFQLLPGLITTRPPTNACAEAAKGRLAGGRRPSTEKAGSPALRHTEQRLPNWQESGSFSP